MESDDVLFIFCSFFIVYKWYNCFLNVLCIYVSKLNICKYVLFWIYCFKFVEFCICVVCYGVVMYVCIVYKLR